MSTDLSVDIAVDSRSTVGRQSVNSRSTVGRQSVDSRSIVSRAWDRLSAEYRSIFRRRTPTHYRSYVGDISVNCRWYISQLSVVYRSTVGGISVNCRSNISRVLIYPVSPMAFFYYCYHAMGEHVAVRGAITL